MGTVIDAETKEPLPFVNVSLKGTTIGTTSDFDGNYSLEFKIASDSLESTFIGYNKQTKPIVRGKFQTINFELKENSISLNEVVIVPGENPAEIILKKLIKNKAINNREKFDAYQYEVYSKIEFDLNNISEDFKNRRVFKPFKFVFENMDTSTVNGKAYLPIFLSESVSDYFYRKKPKTEKEVIKGTKVTGVDNKSIQQFVGNMYVNINFYDNYIPIFQKNFVSPVANFGLMYYRYYLVDSTFINNKWCYKIQFKPRRKQELTFTGNFWVNDTSFALKQIDVRIANDANINLICDLTAYFEYDNIEATNWMTTKEQVIIDFNPLENITTGVFGKRTATYRNFKFDKFMPDEFYNTPTNIITEDGSFEKNKEYWDKARHDSLTKDELAIYKMVDTVKSLPAFKTWYQVVEMLTTGYHVRGNFEWGPYASILSFNDTEGTRFRLGVRTSNAFSKKIMLETYGAYGTLDNRFKYGGSLLYIFNKNPRQSCGFDYKKDLEQLSKSSNAFREDFLLTSVFKRSSSSQLSSVEEFKGFYEKEWFAGFSNTLTLIHRELWPSRGVVFDMHPLTSNSIKQTIVSSEVKLTTRFAFQEKFVLGEFTRFSLGTKYPIISADFTYGFKNIWNSDFEYQKLAINLQDWFNVSPFGWSKYIIEVGQIWGTIPYPLLKLHEGNETYVFDEYAFNLMNFYEFVSDRYISAYFTHHFDGFFLNKIPLMRKLKWREVALVKGVVGSVSDKNRAIMTFPNTLSGISKPYFEVGAGIENIFKIIRIDALWRLSYLDKPNITKFGIRASLQFTF
ncbi:MAG: DUF5686 family protein [Bacteroidota bacterium]